jgi:tetratricopeptide (TPR) repeat protein
MALKAMPMRFALLALAFLAAASAAPNFQQIINQGHAALAKADLGAAERLFENACGEESGLTPDQRASCEHHLAIIDEAKGDYPRAESRLLKALPEWQAAGGGFQASYEMSLLNLGELYRMERRFTESEEQLQHAVAIARLTRTEYPQEYPQALSRLGGLYTESDRAEAGRPLLVEALAIFRQLAPREDEEQARALHALGAIYLTTGQYAEGESLLSEALSLAVAALGENHPETAAYQSDLALAFIQNGFYERAEPLLKRALFAVESRPMPNGVRKGIILAELAMVACAGNKFAIAEEFSRKSLDILDVNPAASPTANLLARLSLGQAWLKQNRLTEAEAILPAAVEEQRRIAPGSRFLADGLRELAELRARQGSWRDSAALYKQAIDIYQLRLGSTNRNLAPVLKAYAEVLKHDAGSRAQAKTIESQARAILSFRPPA